MGNMIGIADSDFYNIHLNDNQHNISILYRITTSIINNGDV